MSLGQLHLRCAASRGRGLAHGVGGSGLGVAREDEGYAGLSPVAGLEFAVEIL